MTTMARRHRCFFLEDALSVDDDFAPQPMRLPRAAAAAPLLTKSLRSMFKGSHLIRRMGVYGRGRSFQFPLKSWSEEGNQLWIKFRVSF